MKRILGVLLCVFFLDVGHGLAGEGKISGYMFGDYYWIAANHDSSLEDRNGFWFRRIYFTYDQGLSDQFSTRLRLEINSPGDFSTSSKLEPFVKDAYLKWKSSSGQQVLLGISGTPTWGTIEKVWGYRAVEKAALDLQKYGSSRDFGIAVKGKLGAEKRIFYHVMLGNGSSNKSETNEEKKVYSALGYKPSESIILEGYVDWEDRGTGSNRYTLQGFGAYQTDEFRVGAHFTRQTTTHTGAENANQEILSVLCVASASEKIHVLGRFDHMFDLAHAGISYLPFDTRAESSNLVIFGVDVSPSKNVHFIPNVEIVLYGDTPSGESPDPDVMPRFTFFYEFK